MAAISAEGYQCEFIDSVPDDFYCKKCNLVAKKLTVCNSCMENYCYACITDTLKQGQPCPTCGEEHFQAMPHVKYQKRMKELQVYCSLKERGCGWSGTLDLLDAHLDPDKNNCQYVDTECPLNCTQTIPKNKVEQHVSEECVKRDYFCQYCSFKATYEEVVDKHLPECKYVALQCPNMCGVTFERDFMEDHMKICRLEEIECVFSVVGCEEKYRREDQEEHTRQNSHKHLTLTASLAKQLQQKLEEQEKKHEDREQITKKKMEDQVRNVEKQLYEQKMAMEKKIEDIQKMMMKKMERERMAMGTKMKEQERKLERRMEEKHKMMELKLAEERRIMLMTRQELEKKIGRMEEQQRMLVVKMDKERMSMETEMTEQEKKMERILEEQQTIVEVKLAEERMIMGAKMREQETKMERRTEEIQRMMEIKLAEQNKTIEELKKSLREEHQLKAKSETRNKTGPLEVPYNRLQVQAESNSTMGLQTFEMKNYSVEVHWGWKSPAMYTHRSGYKFYVEVSLDTFDQLHVALYSMPGDFDAQLRWPAKATFKIELVSQRRGSPNFAIRTEKLTWKKTMFESTKISKSYVLLGESQLHNFLVNNTLKFCVSDIKLG